MIDTNWIDMRHGMSLHEGPWPYRDNENGVLFYLEYIMLKEAQGLPIDEDVTAFKQIIETIRSYDHNNARILGLFDRGEKESKNPDKDAIRVISHDNMTAIAAFSYRYGDGSEARYIADYGTPHFLRYDNGYPESPRWKTIQWPTDWLFWRMSDKSSLLLQPGMVWYPLFLIRCLISSLDKPASTSGKLLNFVRFYSMKDRGLIGKLLWKANCALMRRQYGENWVNSLMTIYFQNLNHPNRILSAGLKL